MGRKLKYLILFIGILLIFNLVYGQQAINGSRYILGYWDASQARWTKPFLTAAAEPATCTVGEVMFDTGAIAGFNIKLCVATDTWMGVQASGSGLGDMTKAEYDTDDDGSVDLAEAATALAANGANCSSGQAALGVDASGAAEGCWTPGTGGGTPAGSAGNVQYNADGTSFGAESALTYDSTTNVLTSGKFRISDTCTLGSPTTLASGTLCFNGTDGLLASDGMIWYTATWVQNASGEIWYSNANYAPTTSSGFSYATNILTVPTVKPTTSIRGTSSNLIPFDPDSDGTIESSIDATGNFSGNAGSATVLASDPTDCSANQFATTIAASGNLTCAAIADADVPDGITASNYLPLAGGTLTGNLALSADSNEGVSGGGLSDCDTAGSSKLLWSSETNKFSCGTDQTGAGGGDEVSVDSTATTNPDFQDGGDINFTYNTGVVTATVKTESVQQGDLDWDTSASRTESQCVQIGATANTLKTGACGGASTQVDIDGDGTQEISLASTALSVDPDENGTAELTIDATGNFFRWDINNDGTTEFSFDADGTTPYFCMDPDDNGNCDFKFIDIGSDATPKVGISFHDAANPTILHDENAKTIYLDYDEDGTYDLTLDGSLSQITLDPNSDGVSDMLLNQTFLQTDQIRYSTTSAARMTVTNGRMHMCGGNQFAPNAAAGACMYLGGSTSTYANVIGFDPDGDGTDESTINTSGVYSGQATTAGALASDPTDCSANQFAQSIATSGNLTCAAISDADVPDTITASSYLPLAGGTLTGNLTLSADSGEGILGGGLTDCDNSTTSKLLWDSSTNKFSCGTDQTSGASTQVDIDGDGTREISLATSIMSIDPNEDGTAELTIDTSADTIYFDPDGDATNESNINASGDFSGKAASATVLAADPSDCSAGQYATTIANSGNLTCGTPPITVTNQWIRNDIGASATVYALIGYSTGLTKLTAPFNGTFYGLSCANNAQISQGTITFTIVNGANDTDLTVQQTTSTAADTGINDTTCTSNCSYTAGTAYQVKIVSAGTVAPTTTDVYCVTIMTIP